MRGPFSFDPALCTYGAATTAVWRILSEWMAVDWFAPPPAGAGTAASRLLEDHHARGRAYAPALFAERIEAQPVRGGWADFAGLCSRVQKHEGWDWKYGVLKTLSSQHSRALGWSADQEAPDLGSLGQGPGPGCLFFRAGEAVIWNNLCPALDLRTLLPPGDADKASWYLHYAGMDVIEAIEWQLAEKSDGLDDNPFVPLMRCYASGFYPFSLGPGLVVLFGFAREG